MTEYPQSAGPLTFHPDTTEGSAVLFAADVAAATVFALELPPEPSTGGAAVDVEQLGAKLASLLGVGRGDVLLRGMAVHPASHAVYLSIARGRGADAGPALVRAGTDGELSVVEVDQLTSTSFALDDAPAPDDERQDVWLDGSDEGSAPREIYGVTLEIAQVPLNRSTITDLAWVDDTLMVAGTSNEEFSSRLRRLSYPFDGTARSTSVEIYHVDHGQYETASPIRALIPFDGGKSVLATYTCTPVVHFSLADLQPDTLVRGRTVAELGPMNQPFSLVSYDRDGEEFLLVSGTRHPLLKIPAASVAGQAPLTDKLEPVGIPREALDVPGVTWMASLDREHVVVVQDDGGDLALHTLSAASL
ncbi:MAG: hypothetical protein ACRYF3_00485 [Janthinobacterium lividum]